MMTERMTNAHVLFLELCEAAFHVDEDERMSDIDLRVAGESVPIGCRLPALR